MTKLKTAHDMWISTSAHRIAVSPPLPMSLHFDQLCTANNESVRQRSCHWNLSRPSKPNRIGFPIGHNPPPLAPPLIGKTVKNLFACQEVNRDCLWAWFAETYDNVVENQSSKDHVTYHEAKERILNLPSNHRSACGASPKNSEPQHEANPVSSSNHKKNKKTK
jgi:hypothetical protein